MFLLYVLLFILSSPLYLLPLFCPISLSRSVPFTSFVTRHFLPLFRSISSPRPPPFLHSLFQHLLFWSFKHPKQSVEFNFIVILKTAYHTKIRRLEDSFQDKKQITKSYLGHVPKEQLTGILVLSYLIKDKLAFNSDEIKYSF